MNWYDRKWDHLREPDAPRRWRKRPKIAAVHIYDREYNGRPE